MDALTETATLRGGSMSREALRLYSERLASEPLDDVMQALDKLATMARRDNFEPAIPEINGLLALIRSVSVARQNRQAAEATEYQQQVCPRCGSLVGMMRPVGEQFRTWCEVCQSYRQIIPDDTELSPDHWNAIVLELNNLYCDWQDRGARPEECIDPQVDRKTLQRVAERESVA